MIIKRGQNEKKQINKEKHKKSLIVEYTQETKKEFKINMLPYSFFYPPSYNNFFWILKILSNCALPLKNIFFFQNCLKPFKILNPFVSQKKIFWPWKNPLNFALFIKKRNKNPVGGTKR